MRQDEIAELEAQLKIMSQAAANAIERASKLEMELESRSTSSSASNSSISSLGSDEQLSPTDRLNILENAMDAIYLSRTELAKPYNYQHI